MGYLNIFCCQKKYNYYLGNYKTYQPENIAALKCESRKTICWVPWNLPPNAVFKKC